MTESLIRVVDLHYTYDAEADAPIPALRGINLEIERGEYVAIIGHNGSGKSTLAKCLNGLLTPTQGDVWVEGLNTRQQDDLIRIRATVGLVFQDPDNQMIAGVVEEEVAFGPENLGIPQDALRRRVDRALADTGLADVRHANPRALSTGQKARLAIASILAMQPACLVLDESTAMLDPVSRGENRALLDRLHGEGFSIVAITHFMDETVDADRVLVLDRGEIALDGPPRRVFAQREILDEMGLAPPAVTRMAHGLRRRGAPLGQDILTLDDLVAAVTALVGVDT